MREQRMFKRRARECREASGESLSEAAARVGCTKAHLWELEMGRSKNPSLTLLVGMAKSYGVTVAWLIGEVP